MAEKNAAAEGLTGAMHKLARMVCALASGPASQTLADMLALDPDNARGFLVGLHTSLALSNGGTDVDFRTNPDFDMAVHSVRAYIEHDTSEVATTGAVGHSAAHAAVKLSDIDRNLKIFEGTSPCAGGAGGIDLALLGAGQGPGDEIELKVPYVFKGNKGSATLRATFATDASLIGTKRMGVLLSCSYRRRSFRQFETLT